MGLFLFTVGVLQLLAGGVWFISAGGAMQETTGAVLVGFGFVALALGAIIERLDRRQP